MSLKFLLMIETISGPFEFLLCLNSKILLIFNLELQLHSILHSKLKIDKIALFIVKPNKNSNEPDSVLWYIFGHSAKFH